MATTEAARLLVRGAELEVALGEVDAVLAAVPEGDYRDRLVVLREELTGDGVGQESVGELDRLVELALQSGRLRAVYAVDGHPMCQRHAALALFNRAMGREE